MSRRRHAKRRRQDDASLDDWPTTSKYVFAQEPWYYYFGRTWPSRRRASARERQLTAWLVVFLVSLFVVVGLGLLLYGAIRG
jgi:hypothetical protein